MNYSKVEAKTVVTVYEDRWVKEIELSIELDHYQTEFSKMK